jgi:hypothetical protein
MYSHTYLFKSTILYGTIHIFSIFTYDSHCVRKQETSAKSEFSTHFFTYNELQTLWLRAGVAEGLQKSRNNLTLDQEQECTAGSN